MADDDSNRDELVRLRDWRHDVATPALVAAREQLKQLTAELRMVVHRLDEVEAQVERMARAEDIAQALRSNLWTTAQKVAAGAVAAVVALTAIANIVLQLTR